MTTPLYRILGEKRDERPQHLAALLAALGKAGDPRWQRVVECMAAKLAFVLREEPRRKRSDTRDRLERIAKLARDLNREMGKDDAIDTLHSFARPNPRVPDDLTGFEYLMDLEARAKRAAARISRVKGDRPLESDLGRPTPEILCAAMVRQAFKHGSRKPPGEKNTRALEACSALWAAAGGKPKPGDAGEAPHGAWIRHIRDTRSKLDAATVSARLSANDCLRQLQQETP